MIHATFIASNAGRLCVLGGSVLGGLGGFELLCCFSILTKPLHFVRDLSGDVDHSTNLLILADLLNHGFSARLLIGEKVARDFQ